MTRADTLTTIPDVHFRVIAVSHDDQTAQGKAAKGKVIPFQISNVYFIRTFHVADTRPDLLPAEPPRIYTQDWSVECSTEECRIRPPEFRGLPVRHLLILFPRDPISIVFSRNWRADRVCVGNSRPRAGSVRT